MKQIRKQEELIGKTIVRTICLDRSLYIFFKDSFCIFKYGIYSEEIELDEEIYSFKLDRWNSADLLQLGFVTQKEVDQFNVEYAEKEKERKKQQDIALLKELKNKYPNN